MTNKKKKNTKFLPTISCARSLDKADPLAHFRSKYHIPKINGKTCIYLCGNSLGLQPKSTKKHIRQELLDWKELGVEGHFHGKFPWFSYHHFVNKEAAKIVGAKPSEVVIMNSLTVNLHLMMVSFYRPTSKSYKILIEEHAFPSDKYAVASQAEHHGFKAKDAIVEIKARKGEVTLRTEDIIDKIKELGSELALVMIGGVNYYTGQFFDLEAITKAGHRAGAKVGFDLAHAAGNVPLKLHKWGVDFAVWCSYKYLNSGPGGTSGVFVNEKHGNNTKLHRFAGWWGNDEKSRFQMPDKFLAQKGAAGWQISNAQILPMAAHKAALELFAEAGMANLRKKSLLLTAFLEFLIEDINREAGEERYKILTPSEPASRGCQISIVAHRSGKETFNSLTERGIIADWREPDVIRVAPVPMYNSFMDVFAFAAILRQTNS